MRIGNPIFRHLEESRPGSRRSQRNGDRGFKSLILSISLFLSYAVSLLLMMLKGEILIYVSGILSILSLILTIISACLMIKKKSFFLTLLFSISSGILVSFISVFVFSLITYGKHTAYALFQYRYASFWVSAPVCFSILMTSIIDAFEIIRIRHFAYIFAVRVFISFLILSIIDVVWAINLSYSITKSLILIFLMVFYAMYMSTLYSNAIERIYPNLTEEGCDLAASLIPSIAIFLFIEAFFQLFSQKRQ